MTVPPSDTLLTIRTFSLLSAFCKCLQDASESSFASLMGICTMQRRVKRASLAHENASIDVHFSVHNWKRTIFLTVNNWLSNVYVVFFYAFRLGRKYMQPRLQTFATPLANVCVREVMRLYSSSFIFWKAETDAPESTFWCLLWGKYELKKAV